MTTTTTTAATTTTTTAAATTTTKPYRVNVSLVNTRNSIGTNQEENTIGDPIQGSYEDENNIIDNQIQDIYGQHNNKNISTYIGNYITIQKLTKKVEALNSQLEKKLNNYINYGADGTITFH